MSKFAVAMSLEKITHEVHSERLVLFVIEAASSAEAVGIILLKVTKEFSGFSVKFVSHCPVEREEESPKNEQST